ncbi:TIGR02611 family protein [Mycobacterium sp. AMU20-3851]|uniref:TIGR02611 family protein n=1 Tax=Mycobacterium sp. AMU20-3851 TaxID=3122055 RepID=UPI0037547AA3
MTGDGERKRAWARWRDKIRNRPVIDLGYRITVGVIGSIVLVVGIIAIPYPGPGWAIVFLGLAILATEFRVAQVALHWVRARYDKAMAWFTRQHLAVQALGALFTTAVVLGTLWLFGAVGLVAGWVGIDWPWLKSPIGIGS